jgi:hypothetical protein
VLGLISDVNGLGLGFSTAGVMATPGLAVTVNNKGKAAAWPIIKLAGAGSALNVTNFTTGEIVNFTGLVLGSNEEAELDLRRLRKTLTSNTRGQIDGKISPAPDHSNWNLQPGENVISLFINGATASAVMVWDVLADSLDAVSGS